MQRCGEGQVFRSVLTTNAIAHQLLLPLWNRHCCDDALCTLCITGFNAVDITRLNADVRLIGPVFVGASGSLSPLYTVLRRLDDKVEVTAAIRPTDL